MILYIEMQEVIRYIELDKNNNFVLATVAITKQNTRIIVHDSKIEYSHICYKPQHDKLSTFSKIPITTSKLLSNKNEILCLPGTIKLYLEGEVAKKRIGYSQYLKEVDIRFNDLEKLFEFDTLTLYEKACILYGGKSILVFNNKKQFDIKQNKKTKTLYYK